MLHGQMLPGQMSLWHLESVQVGPRNLRLKFCQNRFSNSWDIADIMFLVVEQPRLIWWAATAYMVVCKVILTSNPTLGYVRLNWGWVGVWTTFFIDKIFQFINCQDYVVYGWWKSAQMLNSRILSVIKAHDLVVRILSFKKQFTIMYEWYKIWNS